MQYDIDNCRSVVFNLFAEVKLQGNIPVVRGAPSHIPTQEILILMSIISFAQLLAEPLVYTGGALGLYWRSPWFILAEPLVYTGGALGLYWRCPRVARKLG